MSEIEYTPEQAWEALKYEADSLSDEQYAAAVAAADLWAALTYAADALSDERFVRAAAAYPDLAREAAPERFAALQSAEKQRRVVMQGVRRRDGKDNGIDTTDGLY